MKNKISKNLLFLLLVSLVFTGCGKDKKLEENTVNVTEETPDSIKEDSLDNSANDSVTDSATDTANEDVDNKEEASEEEGKGDYLTNIPYVTISERNYDVNENDVYYLSCTRDEISADSVIEDYSALTQAVKEYSDSLVPTKEYLDETVGYAKEDIEYRGEDFKLDPGVSFYTDEADTYVTRVDEKLLSLETVFYTYYSGAHGSQVVTGANFDVKKGKKLAITDVFTDYEGFLDLLKEKSKEQAIMYIGADGLFEDYAETIDNMDPSKMDYDAWFFDAAGFCYTFSDYEIAPHAAGLLTVTINYEDLISYINSDYLSSNADSIELLGEGEKGCVSMVNGEFVYYSNERENSEDTSKGLVSIGADSKLITDNGYINSVYLMKRLDKKYLFINYITGNDIENPRNNCAVIDISDGIKIIYEESDAKIDFSTLDMDEFYIIPDESDESAKEVRYVQQVLGE